MRSMVAKRNTKRKLTWRESDAKYKARGMALGILLRQGMDSEPEGDIEHVDGAPEPPDYTAKFIAICRLLLDVGPKGAVPTIPYAGPVDRCRDSRSTASFAPRRNGRPYWHVPPRERNPPGGGSA